VFDEELNRIAASGGLRSIESFKRRQGPYIEIDGCRYIDFSSNDYLGLSHEPSLIEHAMRVLRTHGMGSGGSRLLGGANQLFDLLEEEIVKLLGTEAALVFGSGYQANLGIVTSLTTKGDTCIILDKLCHASIIDGVLLSKAKFYRFHHNDLDHLEDILRKKAHSFKRVVVVLESVYSMEGDIAPIREIISLKNRYGFVLVVDEAHAIGVFGEGGRGVVDGEEAASVDCIMGTFGKALGGHGAFCATSKALRDLLINRARSFIFSTALPVPVVAWDMEALALIRTLDERRERLFRISKGLRHFLKERLGILSNSRSQIVPVIVGEAQRCLDISRRLRQRGIYVRAIRPPTVPPGTSRLRLSLSALHTDECISQLESCLEDVF